MEISASTPPQGGVLRFPLIENITRPMFFYVVNKGTEDVRFKFLYDTGAEVPVWCRGESLLRWAFPDAVKLRNRCLLSGFGRGANVCSVYLIPELKLKSENYEHSWKALRVFVYHNPSMGCDFIMSAAMFSDTVVTVDQRRERFIAMYFEETAAGDVD